MEYNKKKIENWMRIQEEQVSMQIQELSNDVEGFLVQEMLASDPLEKADIRKKAAEKKKQLDKVKNGQQKKINSIRAEGAKEIDDFNRQFDITPILLVNIVLKF